MKKLLLVLTALSAIAACSAAASPSAQMIADATPTVVAAPPAELAGPPPSETYAAPPKTAAADRISAPLRPVCDIRATPTSHGVQISAVLAAQSAISGDYNLVITKTGASGSSDVQQGGAFNAARGERVTLGQTELGLDRGDRFHAVLTLTDADGRVCREELRS
ncbi:MAG: curli-like amyloid fiber formation chaperone CsgH [Terricaulis sp.]